MLVEARDLFEVLGPEAYVERCSREMRASGVSSGAGGRSVALPKADGGTAAARRWEQRRGDGRVQGGTATSEAGNQALPQ